MLIKNIMDRMDEIIRNFAEDTIKIEDKEYVLFLEIDSGEYTFYVFSDLSENKENEVTVYVKKVLVSTDLIVPATEEELCAIKLAIDIAFCGEREYVIVDWGTGKTISMTEKNEEEAVEGMPDKETYLAPCIFDISESEAVEEKTDFLIKEIVSKHQFSDEESVLLTEALSAYLKYEKKKGPNRFFDEDMFSRREGWSERIKKLVRMNSLDWLEAIYDNRGEYTALFSYVNQGRAFNSLLRDFFRKEMKYYEEIPIHDIVEVFSSMEAKKFFSYRHLFKSVESAIESLPTGKSIGMGDTEEACRIFLEEWKGTDVVNYLKQYIVGQDEGIEAAVAMFLTHVKRVAYPELNFGAKECFVIMGQSGVGKTEIFRRLREISPVEISIQDATVITAEGFSGSSKTDLLNAIYEANPNGIESSIIVFDEIDKLFQSRYESHGGNIGEELQGEMLKLFEDGEILLDSNRRGNKKIISTKNIGIVLVGTFFETKDRTKEKANKTCGFLRPYDEKEDTIEESETAKLKRELSEFGIIDEIVSRVGQCKRLNSLDGSHLKQILLDMIAELQKTYLVTDNVSIYVPEAVIDVMIEQASSNVRLGAREMRNVVCRVFKRKVVMLPEAEETREISLTREDVLCC